MTTTDVYAYFTAKGHRDPDYMFYFEGKWRSGRTLALMLKRRHQPQVYFISISSGRGLGVTVGSWDWTKADWAQRKVTAGYTLSSGSTYGIHNHAFSHGECETCGLSFEAYTLAVAEALRVHGVTL